MACQHFWNHFLFRSLAYGFPNVCLSFGNPDFAFEAKVFPFESDTNTRSPLRGAHLSYPSDLLVTLAPQRAFSDFRADLLEASTDMADRNNELGKVRCVLPCVPLSAAWESDASQVAVDAQAAGYFMNGQPVEGVAPLDRKAVVVFPRTVFRDFYDHLLAGAFD